MSSPDPEVVPLIARRSASADDARRREVERVLAMSPRERALLALRLGRRTRAWAALSSPPR